MIEVAILKNFNAGTYKAGVQLAGSLTTYFDDINVAKNIPTTAMVTGNYVILAIPGGNPKDAVIIATWPGGSPAAGGDMYKSVYDTDDDAVVDAAELAADSLKLQGSTKTEVRDHAPNAHKTSHQDGGSDEPSVQGLSGELADPQKSNFLKLSDTPSSYSGQAGKYVKVNSGATALEFGALAGVYTVVNTPVTYTIGSGQNYATVAAAAAALRSLILEADITLKLMENVTETSLVEIVGQVSMGGMLRIELNGKTWTLSGDLFPKVFIGGLANVVFQTETASGGIIDIQHPSPSGKIPFRLRQMAFTRLTWTSPITINLNSLAFTVIMQLLDNSSAYAHDNVILQNYGSLTYTLRLDLLSRFTFNFAFPGPWLINGGATIIDENGDIWTKKGKVT